MGTEFQRTGNLTLKKELFTVMFITENQSIVMDNADIHELYFIEDIFKFCMMGTIVFNDRFNLMELAPFTGNEKIAVIYSVDDHKTGSKRELVFDIWKMSRIQQAGPGMREEDENLITLHFVDTFFQAFTLRKYSRSWQEERYTNIMRDILNNMVFFKDGGRPFIYEESSNKTDFIIPYWTPQTAMRWLMRRAKGKETGVSGYLCFNNSRNGFTHNLVTMNYLLADIGRTLDKDPYVFTGADKDNEILEWWISGIDRNSNNIIRGGTWKGYDFKTKKLLNHDFVYSKGSDNTVMLGRKTLYPQMDDIRSSNTMIGDSDYNVIDNISYNDWAKRYNMQFIMNLIVEGHEKRYAGQHIQIEWPSWRRGDGNQVQFNDLLKGKYLIKSITHSFDPGHSFYYRQRLVLIRNAYANIGSKVLYEAKKANLFQEKGEISIVGL
jgi:hypothetical protein